MGVAKMLYPSCAKDESEDGSFYGPGSYQPIIDHFAKAFDAVILLQVDTNGYQGDSFVLYHRQNEGIFGVLIFGWGSCSGCDALQACRTLAEIDEVIDSLCAKIIWHDQVGMAVYLSDKESRSAEFYYSDDDAKEFISKSLELVKGKSR